MHVQEEITAEYLSNCYIPGKLLDWLEARESVPAHVVCALYKIETTFRPTWFRIGEWVVLFACVVLSTFGLPLPNMTIGPFQVCLRVVCSFLEVPTRQNGYWLFFKGGNAWELWRKITDPGCLLEISYEHVRQLWDATHGALSNRIFQLGLLYNGSQEYARMLVRVVEKLEQRGRRGYGNNGACSVVRASCLGRS